jgi:VanZ family protein
MNDWKIIKLLAAISKDKLLHFTVCLVMALFIYGVCHVCGLGYFGAIPAFCVPMILGIVKEISDKKTGSELDHYDVIADFFGCFVALVFIALV